jgi:DNA-binding response OmpR family regulator
MLTKHGYITIKADNGKTALKKIRLEAPDLILLDNIMPEMSGIELVRILKSSDEYNDIPIIMFTAVDDLETSEECLKLGVNEYITKPFMFSKLLDRIVAAINKKDI